MRETDFYLKVKGSMNYVIIRADDFYQACNEVCKQAKIKKTDVEFWHVDWDGLMTRMMIAKPSFKNSKYDIR